MLELRDVTVRFGRVRAVAGVSLTVPDGPYGFGLVGESGAGKSTVGRAVCRLVDVAAGTIRFDGVDVLALKRLGPYRRAVQIVVQDPDGALDPRQRVGAAIGEVLRAHRIVPRDAVAARVRALLAEVGLPSGYAACFPHQLSGGQRQRVALARALALRPRLIVLDEPTSALDVTTQARVLGLIERLREEHRLAYLLISHNLAVVERLCEQVAVMYLGRIVEQGPTGAVLARPAHPYTAALRSAVPEPARRAPRIVLPGDPVDPAAVPPGCPFHPRCPVAVARCRHEVPTLAPVGAGHHVACHRAREIHAGLPLVGGSPSSSADHGRSGPAVDPPGSSGVPGHPFI